MQEEKATEEANEQVDLFNDYLDEANAEARNIELGTYQSAVGTAYKAILKEDDWTKDSELPPFGFLYHIRGLLHCLFPKDRKSDALGSDS